MGGDTLADEAALDDLVGLKDDLKSIPEMSSSPGELVAMRDSLKGIASMGDGFKELMDDELAASTKATTDKLTSDLQKALENQQSTRQLVDVLNDDYIERQKEVLSNTLINKMWGTVKGEFLAEVKSSILDQLRDGLLDSIKPELSAIIRTPAPASAFLSRQAFKGLTVTCAPAGDSRRRS